MRKRKRFFKERLKQIDPEMLLTEKGFIKSYKVDSFEHNPMGGIIVYLYIMILQVIKLVFSYIKIVMVN